MSLQSTADVPLLVTSTNASSERRISPSWTISYLKSRLETMTGIPPSCQRLMLQGNPLHVEDEDRVQLGSFSLEAYAELQVHDTRPAAARIDFNDVSAVQKYVMPEDEYEHRQDSVLAWKKAQKLGRFDPDAPSIEEQKVREIEREIENKGLTLARRCRLLPPTTPRHGTISYVGPIPQLPGAGPWIGITLDEPTGKNDGSVKGAKYFQCKLNCGVFVRPERVEAGDFGVVDLDDDDLEEI